MAKGAAAGKQRICSESVLTNDDQPHSRWCPDGRTDQPKHAAEGTDDGSGCGEGFGIKRRSEFAGVAAAGCCLLACDPALSCPIVMLLCKAGPNWTWRSPEMRAQLGSCRQPSCVADNAKRVVGLIARSAVPPAAAAANTS